jgi:hypothetical protein
LGDTGIEENNIKMNVRNKLLMRAIDWAVSEYGPMAGFVHTMLNIRVLSIKGKNFLTSWITIRLGCKLPLR